MSYKTFQGTQEELERLVGDIDPGSARGKTRRRLLDAATEQFVAHGYRKTSIDEIARRAGIGKGSVYLHFATKSDMMLAALAREKLDALHLMRAAFRAELSPRERLRECVRAMLMMAAGSPLISRVVAGDTDLAAIIADLDPALISSSLADREEFFGAMLDALVAPEVWSETARHERVIVLTSLGHFAPRLRDDRLRQGLSLERFVDILADLIVHGVQLA